MVEFQAVILAGGPGSSMYPLTSPSLPKALLPVANAPLLSYQLNLLAHAQIPHAHVIVATTAEYAPSIREFLSFQYSKVKVVALPSDLPDTADVIRALAPHITSDFFLISADLITEASIHTLADAFRIRSASAIALYKELTPDALKTRRREASGVVDYVLLDATSSKLLMVASHASTDPFSVPKAILKQHPAVELRTDLFDAHLYVFKRWVVDVLLANAHLDSVKSDLLPHLVRMQHVDTPEFSNDPASLAEKLTAAAAAPASAASDNGVRCFAMILPPSGPYVARVNTVPAYERANKEIFSLAYSPLSTPWPKPESGIEDEAIRKQYRKSLVDAGCTFGAKVALKNSIVGKHCKFGDGCKLNNCVLMDHVVVEDNAVVQNSVLCASVNVGAGANVNECQVAANCEVEAGQRLVKEVIAVSEFAEFQ